MTTRRLTLKYDVFVTSPEPTVTNVLPHGLEQRLFPPISATLISGEQEAVLVDALLTVGQARDLADWVAAQGKHLMAVYITHGHGDHWFGLSVIRARFPDARTYALPAVIERMRKDAAPESMASYWKQQFPGKLPDDLVFAEPLPDHTLALEGHNLVAVELGHTDTDDTTCLHVPEIGLLVTGDSVYNDVHLHLEESDLQGRRDWLAALDAMESLRPRAVIAGHQRAGRHDGPEILEETRQYIRDFDRLAQTTETALALYDQMLGLYPERINPAVLWNAARAQKRTLATPR